VTHQLASTGWTEARIETLKQLWADGMSASQIASRIGGVSRNAVIGKVHRLGLSGRATVSRLRPVRRSIRVSPIPSRTPAPPARTMGEAGRHLLPPVPAGVGPSPAGRIDLASLTDGACRWPLGDPKQPDFHFCGGHANGAVYCEHHARIAYQATARQRRAVNPLVCWRKSHA
jgi:GcrA cell cycle regulator